MSTEASVKPRGMSLFEIDETLCLLLEAREDADAEVQAYGFGPETVALVEKVKSIDADIARYVTDLTQKVDRVSGLLRQWDAEEAILRSEAQRITKLALASAARRDHMKQVICATMEARGVNVYKGQTSVIRCKGNGGVKPLVITSESALGFDLMQITARFNLGELLRVQSFLLEMGGSLTLTVLNSPQIEPCTDRIRQALEAGKKVEGAHLAERGSHIEY